MRFLNREAELAWLKEAKSLSQNKLFGISIYGLRRIGKTRLILEFLKKDDFYFFVNKDKTSGSLLREYEESLKKAGVLSELESVKDWEGFFRVLFGRYKGTVAFDEFQNFAYVEMSVFGILQKYIDLNENSKGLLFIFSGSVIGLIKKMFSDSKEPLYGRLKRQLNLKPLSFANTVRMCREAGIGNLSEIISLHAVFGGFPKYYVAIEDENLDGKGFLEILERFFFMENAIFENEVSTILSLEFGKRSGVYYDVLTAIAGGCTRISEISSFMSKKETRITRQINELVHYFEMVGVEKQAVGGKKRLFIKHPLVNVWFAFFYKNLSSYKRRESWLVDKIKNGINGYVGKKFEQVCREFLAELNAKGGLPFKYSIAGRQWGKIQGKPKGENQYEIDILALNEQSGDALFCECKWQKNADAKKIIRELKEKAVCVPWHNGKRREYYAIFAKSFREKIKEPDVMLFDLKDMERVFRA